MSGVASWTEVTFMLACTGRKGFCETHKIRYNMTQLVVYMLTKLAMLARANMNAAAGEEATEDVLAKNVLRTAPF